VLLTRDGNGGEDVVFEEGCRASCNEYYEFGGGGLMESVMPVGKVNRDEPREYDRTRLNKAKEEKELGGCLVGTRGRAHSVSMHFGMRGSKSGVTGAERRGYDNSQRI